jgi:transcriptional regulator with XRE-family HTH domain
MKNIAIDIDQDIGQQMIRIREDLNLKQGEVAKAMGINQSLLSYYEHDKRQHKVDTLKKFLEVCRAYSQPNCSHEEK